MAVLATSDLGVAGTRIADSGRSLAMPRPGDQYWKKSHSLVQQIPLS